MRIAVIDMGSNTFHLLIAEQYRDELPKIIFKERSFVHLAKNGLGFLDEDTLSRASEALLNFAQIIKNHDVQKTILVGTAALRSASNINEFQAIIQDIYHQDLLVISGDQEADFIFQGVLMAADYHLPDSVIMDIGGGSVEFIISQTNESIWRYSYPIGISAIISKFKPSDPITQKEVIEIYDYLDDTCADLLIEINKNNVRSLTGSSGTFEVFADNVSKQEMTENFWKLDLAETKELLNKTAQMTLQEREDFPGFPVWRAALMPSAVVLILWALDRLKIETLYYSNYALKEGMLQTLITSQETD